MLPKTFPSAILTRECLSMSDVPTQFTIFHQLLPNIRMHLSSSMLKRSRTPMNRSHQCPLQYNVMRFQFTMDNGRPMGLCCSAFASVCNGHENANEEAYIEIPIYI